MVRVLGNMVDRLGDLWKPVAVTLLGAMLGWWSRQLTLEIPPSWFLDDVRSNTQDLRDINRKIREIEVKLTAIEARMEK